MYDAAAELVAAYRSTPQILQALLRGLPHETIRASGQGDDSWSIVEVVWHLRDAEERNLARAHKILAEDHPTIEAFDENVLARNSNYQNRPIAGAFQEFSRIRAEHVELLASLDAASWQRSGHHTEIGEVTIAQLTAHHVSHDAIHLAQISRRIMETSGQMILSVQSL